MIETKIHQKLATHFFIKCRHVNNFQALSERIKNVLSSLISTQQTAYIKNRFTGESGRLISDIVDMYDRNNIGGYLVTMGTNGGNTIR